MIREQDGERVRPAPEGLATTAPAAAVAGGGASPQPAMAEQVLSLQRSVGNRAVARAVLARDEWTPGAPVSLGFEPRPAVSPGINAGFGLTSPRVVPLPEPIPEAVRSKVIEYLETQKLNIGLRVDEGSISMPEVVASIRSKVPESLRIEPWQIQMLVREVMGRQAPPFTRGKRSAGSATAEILATIANALPKPPTSIKLESRSGSLELSISGIEAKTTIGGAKITAKAGTSEGSVEVEKGPATVGVEGSYKGDSFGVSTKIGDATFGAKIEKENETWSKWSMSLKVAVVGDMSESVLPADQLKETVEKANAAVSQVINHLLAGGSPTDEVVKKALEDIKPAIDGVSNAVKKPKGPSVSVGANVSGSSTGWSAGLSLIVHF